MRFLQNGLIVILIGLAYCVQANNTQLAELLKKAKEEATIDSANFFKLEKEISYQARSLKDYESLALITVYKGYYYYYTRNLKKATECFEKAKQISNTIPKSKANLLARIRLVYMQKENGYLEVVEGELNNLKNEALRNHDYENLLEIYNFIGITLEDQNKVDRATQTYLEGLRIAEKKNLPYFIGVFRNNLGLIKFDAQQYEESLQDFRIGLENAQKVNNKRLSNHLNLNLGLYYIYSKQFDTAEVILKDVLNFARKNRLPLEYGTAFSNIATAYESENNSWFALRYYDSAITVFQKHHLIPQLIKSYLKKARMLFEMNRINNLKQTIQNINHLLITNPTIEDQISLYDLTYRLNKKEGKNISALENLETLVKLKDSLNQKRYNKSVNDLILKYKLRDKEAELNKERLNRISLEQEKQKANYIKTISIILSLTFLTLFIIVITLFYYKKISQKQAIFTQELIKKIDEERNRIGRDLHDDLGPHLSIIKAGLNKIQKDSSKLDEVSQQLSVVITKVRELSKNLYPSIIESIGLTGAVGELLKKVQESTHIHCSYEFDESVELLEKDIKLHIYRILQECIHNTIKHSEASALRIIAEYCKNELTFRYMDNGKKNITELSSKGLGLKSIQERAQIIHSVCAFEKTNQGFHLQLKLKL